MDQNQSNNFTAEQQNQGSEHRGNNPKSLKAQMNRILALTKKETKILWNDKFAMILLIALPISMVFLINFGGAGSAGARLSEQSSRLQTPIMGILDIDNSQGFDGYDLSSELVKIYQDYEQEQQCILYTDLNRSQLEEAIGLGTIHAYLIIENGFEFNLSTHFVSYFTVVIDSYNSLIYQDVESLLDETIGVFSERFGFKGAIDQRISYINVPQKALKLFQIAPIFFPMVIFSMTTLVNSQSVIGDIPKDRMVLTPAKKNEILLGKLFGSSIASTIMVFTLWILSIIFGMQIRGSLWVYFLIMWICGMIGTAMGLLLSALASSRLAAFQFFILVFISQVILILFINDEVILSLFPIYSIGQLMMQVILQGMPLLAPTNGYIPLLYIGILEFLAFYFGAYLRYSSQKSLI